MRLEAEYVLLEDEAGFPFTPNEKIIPKMKKISAATGSNLGRDTGYNGYFS
jgi:hypothetical protein